MRGYYHTDSRGAIRWYQVISTAYTWPVPRLPTCPDHLPAFATGVRVGVRVTGRNRQHRNGWNTRVRSAHDSAYKEIVNLGHFLTIGALHFDLAAKMVVGRNTFGPGHAEMMFAIGAHERIVAWH